MEYFSTKTYTHAQGLSCCFRQHKASHSHCQYLHGYALQIQLTFAAASLDERNWVQDFGGLKSIKAWLEQTFDHKLLVAEDDPQVEFLIREVVLRGIAQVVLVKATGCEAFAEMIGDFVQNWLRKNQPSIISEERVRLVKVEVSEHGGNSAGVMYG